MDKNLELFEKYGENVFMGLPFLDNVIVKAAGLYIFDANGKKIMDFGSGTFCALLGHNHPKLTERLKRQLDTVVHTGSAFTNIAFFETAEKIKKIAPGCMARTAFFSTGSEANEVAIRIAKEYTGRYGVMGFDQGHLGSTFLMNQLSYSPSEKPSGKPRISGICKMFTPTCYRCPVNAKYPGCDFLCIKISEKKLKLRLHQVAAMIVEPVLSEAGVVIPPPGYFKRLKDVLDGYGILIITDEAQTAFGRTGKWFAIEHHGVIPDILVASKTCGSGYPVSLVAVHPILQDKLIRQGFSLNASHMNDPLGASAVSAVIDIVKEEGLLENARTMGSRLSEALRELKKDFTGLIRDVRGIGLMAGLELGIYGDENPQEIGLRLAYTLIENGLNVNWFSPSVIIFEPPLIITDRDIDVAVEIIRRSIGEVAGDRMKNKINFKKNPIASLIEIQQKKRTSFFQRAVRKIWLR